MYLTGGGSTVYRKNLLYFVPNICKIVFYSSYKMTSTPNSQPEWATEKNKILNLPLEEKRKLYKSVNCISLYQLETWQTYAVSNNVESRKHTTDDMIEFKKNKFNTSSTSNLASKVTLFKGDITTLEIDAIVNAANSRLKAGGGVDGAIHRAAGYLLQEECHSLGGCPTGESKITGGYNLPAKYVIHTVGPQDGSEKALQSCYESSLAYQPKYELKSIAFPCISTGIYGFPNRLACHIALRTVRNFLETHADVERVIFCTFLPLDVTIYETLMQLYFPLHENNYHDE